MCSAQGCFAVGSCSTANVTKGLYAPEYCHYESRIRILSLRVSENLIISAGCSALYASPRIMSRPFSTVDCARSVVITSCDLLFCLSFFLCLHCHPLRFGFGPQRLVFLFLHRHPLCGGFESCSLCQWDNRAWSTLAKWNNWPFRNNWYNWRSFATRNHWTFEAAGSLGWL